MKNIKWIVAVAVSLLVVALVVLWPSISITLSTDKCLDQGGAWDYVEDECVKSE